MRLSVRSERSEVQLHLLVTADAVKLTSPMFRIGEEVGAFGVGWATRMSYFAESETPMPSDTILIPWPIVTRTGFQTTSRSSLLVSQDTKAFGDRPTDRSAVLPCPGPLLLTATKSRQMNSLSSGLSAGLRASSPSSFSGLVHSPVNVSCNPGTTA